MRFYLNTKDYLGGFHIFDSPKYVILHEGKSDTDLGYIRIDGEIFFFKDVKEVNFDEDVLNEWGFGLRYKIEKIMKLSWNKCSEVEK